MRVFIHSNIHEVGVGVRVGERGQGIVVVMLGGGGGEFREICNTEAVFEQITCK